MARREGDSKVRQQCFIEGDLYDSYDSLIMTA